MQYGTERAHIGFGRGWGGMASPAAPAFTCGERFGVDGLEGTSTCPMEWDSARTLRCCARVFRVPPERLRPQTICVPASCEFGCGRGLAALPHSAKSALSADYFGRAEGLHAGRRPLGGEEVFRHAHKVMAGLVDQPTRRKLVWGLSTIISLRARVCPCTCTRARLHA